MPEAESYSEAAQEGYQEIPDESFVPARTVPAVQVNEAFEVARNSVELLSTVLSSSPQKEVLQVSLFSVTLVKSLGLGVLVNISLHAFLPTHSVEVSLISLSGLHVKKILNFSDCRRSILISEIN